MTSDNNALKNCSFCGENIPLRAGRCPYCGSILEVTVDSSYHMKHMDPWENASTPQNASTPGDPTAPRYTGTIENPVMTGNPDGTEKPSMPEHSTEPEGSESHNEPPIAGNTDTEEDKPVIGAAKPEPYPDPQRNVAQSPGTNPNLMNSARPYNYNRSIPERKPKYNAKNPLSNGMKVFLTVICTIIPGLGQLIGIIAAIIFMNTDDDSDRKSFGVALLVASLAMFVFACIGCFILVIAIASSNQMPY